MITLVTGLGRCGTSLMMQMLEAGGFPIFPGQNGPLYEDIQGLWEPVDCTGRSGALKWIQPPPEAERSAIPPPKAAATILMTRNLKEQAASQLKLIASVDGTVFASNARKRLQSALRSEERRMRRRLKMQGRMIEITFEQLVHDPRKTIERLAKWLGFPLDVEAAVAAIRPRETGARCLPDMEDLFG